MNYTLERLKRSEFNASGQPQQWLSYFIFVCSESVHFALCSRGLSSIGCVGDPDPQE